MELIVAGHIELCIIKAQALGHTAGIIPKGWHYTRLFYKTENKP